jgi:hypothetical protein
MKQLNILLIVLGLALAPSFAAAPATKCDQKKPKELQGLIGRFYFDNSIVNAFDDYDRRQIQETHLSLYKRSVYNLVFDASMLPKGVNIKVFEKEKEKDPKARKLLYSSANDTISANSTYSYKLPFPDKKVVVVYDVPEHTKRGCVTLVLGFRTKEDVFETERKTRKPRVRIVD